MGISEVAESTQQTKTEGSSVVTDATAIIRQHSADLARRVEQRKWLRQPLGNRNSTSPIIVAAHPRKWYGARTKLTQLGYEIAGYLNWSDPIENPRYNGRPVYRTAADLPPELDVVFVGKARKAEFECSPPAFQQCYWFEPNDKYRNNKAAFYRHVVSRVDQYCRVFEALNDEPSKETFASIMRARLEAENGYLQIASYAEYDHPLALPAPGDVVIDGGSFDGHSSIQLASAVGPEGRVFAMEPETENYLKVCEATSSFENIIPCAFGLWKQRAVLSFSSGDAASSKLEETGDCQVPVTSIDEIVRSYCLKRLDLIKLDVEGVEGEALEGGWSSIKRFRPRLHVSIYHKPNDFLDLTKRLIEGLSDYCYFLGHHNYYHTETDLYAVPRERLPRKAS